MCNFWQLNFVAILIFLFFRNIVQCGSLKTDKKKHVNLFVAISEKQKFWPTDKKKLFKHVRTVSVT